MVYVYHNNLIDYGKRILFHLLIYLADGFPIFLHGGNGRKGRLVPELILTNCTIVKLAIY